MIDLEEAAARFRFGFEHASRASVFLGSLGGTGRVKFSVALSWSTHKLAVSDDQVTFFPGLCLHLCSLFAITHHAYPGPSPVVLLLLGTAPATVGRGACQSDGQPAARECSPVQGPQTIRRRYPALECTPTHSHRQAGASDRCCGQIHHSHEQ